MKVTNTKTETTMYDTNGKKISIVKKEILEVDTTPHLLNREEGKQVSEKVTVYKTDLNNAKAVKEQLEKVQGSKKGRQIFHSMADLIMVVGKPTSEEVLVDITINATMNKNFGPGVAHFIYEAANGSFTTDGHTMTGKPNKQKHKQKKK